MSPSRKPKAPKTGRSHGARSGARGAPEAVATTIIESGLDIPTANTINKAIRKVVFIVFIISKPPSLSL